MKALLSSALLLSLSFGSDAMSQGLPEVFIRDLTYAGTGCPVGSLDYAVTTHRDSVALRLSSNGFLAQVGPGVPFSASRKFCQLLIDLEKPAGLQYRVLGLAFSGSVALEQDVNAVIRTSSYFQGSLEEVSSETQLAGPLEATLAQWDDFSSQDVWSPCDAERALNLKISTYLTGPRGASGLLALDSPVGVDPNFIVLEFRECVPANTRVDF